MPLIAIDGPGGAGKSTVAGKLAARLGLERLDTGAMYRAVTQVALERGVVDDPEALAEIARTIDLQVSDRIEVDGVDVTEAIRSPEVDATVSGVSAHAPVRAALVERQRAWVRAHGGAVVEGRDIGTVVLPHADLKVFLTAHPDVRARRRAGERSSTDGQGDVAAVRTAIDTRDRIDSTRAVSPLVPAEDALVIDSSERTVDSIVDEIVSRLPAPPPGRGQDAGSRPVRPISWRARWFYAACRALTVGLSRILLPGKVIGRENVPRQGAFIFAPLHRSDIDFLIVARITRRRLRFIAKAGIFVNRPFSWLIETLGAFPVHRGTTDRKAFDRSLEVLRAGEPLVLFPEGTRNVGPKVGKVLEGAAYLALRAGVPIVPVGLAGTERGLPIGARMIHPGRIAIVVGEPLMAGVERSAAGQGHVPRSAVHALTEELVGAIQEASDEASLLLSRK